MTLAALNDMAVWQCRGCLSVTMCCVQLLFACLFACSTQACMTLLAWTHTPALQSRQYQFQERYIGCSGSVVKVSCTRFVPSIKQTPNLFFMCSITFQYPRSAGPDAAAQSHKHGHIHCCHPNHLQPTCVGRVWQAVQQL